MFVKVNSEEHGCVLLPVKVLLSTCSVCVCVCVCVSVCSVLGDTRDELQCDSESRLRCRARGAL